MAPGEEYVAVRDCAWYNNAIARIAILEIDIEYMDGPRKTFNRNEVNMAFGYPKLTRGYTAMLLADIVDLTLGYHIV